MKKRAARGARVVVTVPGANDVDAGKVARARDRGPRVSRAQVKSVRAKGAILDVVVAGGDGITLAL